MGAFVKIPRKGSLKAHHRWSDKHLAPWAIASLVLTVIQSTFSLQLIGVGSVYRVWVTWLPLALGTIVLATLRWRYVLLRIKEMETLGWKAVACAFICVQGLLFSYTSFGLAARTAADILARTEMRTGSVFTEYHSILSASMRGRNPAISFVRNGEPELLRTAYMHELIEPGKVHDFDLVLHTTPGILGTTILLNHSVVRTQREQR